MPETSFFSEAENTSIPEERDAKNYQEMLERLDQVVEELNLSGLNKKQSKLIKKYYKERGNW